MVGVHSQGLLQACAVAPDGLMPLPDIVGLLQVQGLF